MSRPVTLSHGALALLVDDTAEGRGVFDEVVARDCYGLRALKDAGEEVKVAWDLGASWGLASAVIASLWPGAEVHAFEPHPGRYALAANNLSSFPGVRLYNAGLVGSLGDPVRMLDGVAYDGVWRKSPLEAFGAELSPNLVSAREFIPRGVIDLMKIDVEGFEAGILRDVKNAGALPRVRRIRGEWHFNALVDLPRILRDTHDVEMRLPLDRNPWGAFEAVLRAT